MTMVRFANDVLAKMSNLVKELEVTLGPDTGDLNLRIGIHSGPVTAGVLRGQKSRFQLFGDTMNTCSRIESTGQSGRIHLSEETAQHLINEGKGHWIEKRAEMVSAKGKGQLVTYWVTKFGTAGTATESSSRMESDETEAEGYALYSGSREQSKKERAKASEKINRLIDWNSEVFIRLLRQIVASRASQPTTRPTDLSDLEEKLQTGHSVIPLDEVQEIVHLPESRSDIDQSEASSDALLSKAVMDQVHEFVSCIASMYRPNPCKSLYQHFKAFHL